MTKRSPFRYFKTSPEIIRVAVMLYVRFPLLLRNVEDPVHERGIEAGRQSRAVERVEQFPCNLCNATAVKNTASLLHRNIYCKTYSYICSNCFGIIAPLAPPLPPNRGGKRVTEACSTATLPSFCTVGAIAPRDAQARTSSCPCSRRR